MDKVPQYSVLSSVQKFAKKKKKKKVTQFNKNLSSGDYAHGLIPSVLGQSLIHEDQPLKSYL